MRKFNKREREIIYRCYADSSRICYEREWEAHNNESTEATLEGMAQSLKELMLVRCRQILKYDCELPIPKRLMKVQEWKIG